jgi:hypothetical protein
MQREKRPLGLILLLIGGISALSNFACTQWAVAQNPIEDDKAKRVDDKQTLKEDAQAVDLYSQALRQYEDQLAKEEESIKTAQAKLASEKSKKQADPSLVKLLKDEQAKAAVTRTYAKQYGDYVARLQARVARDRSLIQQDSIDMAADDASRRLAQESALQTTVDPNIIHYDQYGNPVLGQPYWGGGTDYGNVPPDYTYYGRDHDRYWGPTGGGGTRGGGGVSGASGHSGATGFVGGGHR